MCSSAITTATSETSEKVWPEEARLASSSSSLLLSLSWWRQVYNRWTYSYMNEILAKGSEQAKRNNNKNGPRVLLSAEDLYPVPATMTAQHLSREFRKYYKNFHNPQDENEYTSSSTTSLRRFLSTLWHLAAPTFVPAGFCQLLSVLCQVVLPLLVRQLLTLLENHPGETIVRQGMPYAILIFMTSVVNAFGNHRHRHLALKTGVILRAASVQELYQHVLHLTPAGREGLTSGQVTNLIAVDTQKLFEVAQEAHLIWALPLSIILVTALLVWIMGPTTLIGIAVLVLFLPIVERITSGIHKVRQVRVEFTDQRVEIVNSMLQGIKVTKLNNYEANYLKRVTEARDLELMHLKKELAIWALSLLVTVSSPVIATAATFATYVLVDDDNILTAAKTFSVLLLFAALRFPINYAGRLIGKAAQAISASQRIARFLERETRESDQSQIKEVIGPDDAVLSLVNAGFSIATTKTEKTDKKELVEESSRKQNFRVKKFNIELKKGEVLAICGPVASGKSTFVDGIIDEVPALENSVVTKRGRVAYVPQTPFILNTTFRENILFGQPFQKNLYDRVVEACSLRTDIEQLGEAKDLTEIGERGVTLSGGQKQRVALARAAYSQPDLVLLDDPLSALDAGTAKAVFEQLLKSENALFSTAATVLVTHASHFLSQVDQVIIIAEGMNRFQGTWKELALFQPEDEVTRSAVEFIRSSVQEGLTKDSKKTGTEYYENTEKASDGAKKAGKLMSIEEREFGLSSVRVWVLWFRRAGGWYFLGIQVLLMALDRFAYVAVEYWLARWTQGADQSIEVFGIEFPPQTDGLSAQYKYLKIFASLLCTSVFFTALRSEWAVTGGSRASRNVFAAMLQRVLYAPMSYFQTTPMGRILNRFTFDMEVIDVLLTQVMSMFLISCSWYVAGVVLMCTILPWMTLAVFPVTAAFWYLLLHYRRSATDLQRLDALSRSPIQAMISEGLDGSSTLRVFRQEQTFRERFFSAVDRNSSAMLNFVSSQRWLGIRIELLGSVIVLCSSVLIVALNGIWKIEPGLVGLLINWSGNFTITLGFLIETFGEVEASITAIERVDAMSRLPQEKSMVTDEAYKVPPSWPEHGNVEFDNVCLRYREGLPLALNNLSFTIPAGKRCGVVGRTGAGKSSLTVALFRLEEIESGCIRLDGVDLANLGLSDVRGRPNGMAIIPQDPFLTGSTLRECLDPFAANSDEDVLSALRAVRLASADATIDLLNTPLEEGGSNYSVGERQLLNLAAALLSKPKVLVCDEATASIDYESDAFVQRMLRERFQNTTLITVAHRLNTIMDYDLILVMDQGRAAEMGSPKELLSKEDGTFSKLVDATGEEASRALRAMVSN